MISPLGIVLLTGDVEYCIVEARYLSREMKIFGKLRSLELFGGVRQDKTHASTLGTPKAVA